MEPDLSKYELAGDNSRYASAGGLVVPVVTRAGQEPGSTAQSDGATRISGVSAQHTPATRIWFGQVRNEAGYRSVPHHHGEAETGGFVLSGRARIYFGEKFADYIDMSEGDWVFVPPFMPHVECNLDRGRPLTWMTARTPENIVVNLPQVDDGELPDWVERP
ncbi:MAG TPA: cupin domain-containing protein [Trebonia sp.]